MPKKNSDLKVLSDCPSSPNSSPNHMRRELKNRHIQLIALGGAIGTGLFYGSAESISQSGPSVLLVYFVTGLMIFLVMRHMGEMIVDEPTSGSFSYFAHKYWGPFAGFLSGWNYWLSYIVVNMVELTIIGEYVRFWFPHLPNWISALIAFIGITFINLVRVVVYGELEFILALVKVLTILLLMGVGAFLIATGGPDIHINNLWTVGGGFIPHGILGVLASIAVVIFAYGGTELIGVAAGETKDPANSIPKAVNQVMWRILLFYIGALTVIMVIIPWNKIDPSISPFIQIFSRANIPYAAHIINFVLITAILSAYNSGLYANARMLHNLAAQGNAPLAFMKTNNSGVPVNGILFSSSLIGIVVALQYLFPISTLFNFILSFSVACDTITRIMIIITHMKFKKAKILAGTQTAFPAPWYPVSNYLALAFMFLIFIIILALPESLLSMSAYKLPILLSPIWVGVLYISYRYSKNKI